MKHNPYDILGVSQAASKAEINKAVVVAMKRKQYPIDIIAKAQKNLLNSEERVMADYLRPVLPTIKRFKYSDLSALGESAPKLTLLAEFDGLEAALNQSVQEESLEGETLTIPLPELFREATIAYQEGMYSLAIKYLEEYCRNYTSQDNQDYVQAYMWLVGAYHKSKQPQEAVVLCQLLINHANTKLSAWAKKILPNLSKEVSCV